MVIHLVWPIVSTNQAVDGRFPLIKSIYSIYTQYSELARTISISPKFWLSPPWDHQPSRESYLPRVHLAASYTCEGRQHFDLSPPLLPA